MESIIFYYIRLPITPFSNRHTDKTSITLLRVRPKATGSKPNHFYVPTYIPQVWRAYLYTSTSCSVTFSFLCTPQWPRKQPFMNSKLFKPIRSSGSQGSWKKNMYLQVNRINSKRHSQHVSYKSLHAQSWMWADCSEIANIKHYCRKQVAVHIALTTANTIITTKICNTNYILNVEFTVVHRSNVAMVPHMFTPWFSTCQPIHWIIRNKKFTFWDRITINNNTIN